MKKIIYSLLAVLLCFILVGCNEGASGGGQKTKKFSGNYEYKPPTNNYYVEAKDIKDEKEITITARIDKQFTLLEKDSDDYEYMYHANEENKKIYTKYEGKWYIDSNSSYDEYEENEEVIEPFNAMEEYFMRYFRAYGYENEKLEEYYVGNEKVAEVDCWVFDSKGLNAVYMKFWVNPSNGTVLKYLNTESETGKEVTKMDLNYKKWTDDLAPASYDNIEGL